MQVQTRTIALLPVRVPDLDVVNIYGTDVTAENAIAKFPDQNPNPVLRIDVAGALIYANPASAGIVAALGIRHGDRLPADLGDAIGRRLAGESSELIEVRGDGRIYAITPVAVPESGFTNLYGTDVTGLRAIDRFPNDNPNPVLRASRDGILTYANPASEPVRRALGAEVGQTHPGPGLGAPHRRLGRGGSGAGTLEVEWGDRLFSLTVVSVYEFESVNIYGTDITAAREVERLLLNILPASIAGRLRAGERLIADRFDEMAVLFADIVNFTPFAQAHPPDEVVNVLNSVFSVFDELADRYGLEKIKTIGDSYMVVGGIQGDADGPERVARMGLDMIERLRDFRTPGGDALEIRVGMHVGPVVGGVIGLKKFIYDVWGHTVNTASRMESHGLPGRLQVTESARERLAARVLLRAARHGGGQGGGTDDDLPAGGPGSVGFADPLPEQASVFDPDQVPLSTSEGRRPPSTAGDRMMIGLAVLALVGGLLIAASRLIPEQANQTSQATATPVQSTEPASPSPRPTASPRDVRTMTVDPAPIPSVSPPGPYVSEWVRLRIAVTLLESPSSARTDRPSAPGRAGIHHRRAGGTGGRRWLASGRRAGQRLDLRRDRQRGHVRALPGPLAVDQRRVQPRVRIQRLPVLRLAYEWVRRRGACLVRRRAVAHIRRRRCRLGANGRERAGRLAHGRQRRWPQCHDDHALAVAGRRVMGAAGRPAGGDDGRVHDTGRIPGGLRAALRDRQRRLGSLVLGRRPAVDRATDRAAAPGHGNAAGGHPARLLRLGPQRPRHRG